MKGFDVLHVKSAVKSRNVIDLSFDHLTTMDFGEIVPLVAKEMVPSDEFPINGSYFSRMAPLVKPTYGKFSFNTVAAFVPYHQIANDADAWIDGKTSFEGASTHHRFFTFADLTSFILNYCTLPGTIDNSDFTLVDANGTVIYRELSRKGKYYVKVLTCLGYSIPQCPDVRSTSEWSTKVGVKRLSAYPLLAFFKLYNDYMSQSQRYNVSELSSFLHAVKHSNNYSTGLWNSSTGEIFQGGLNLLFDNLRLNYENDYFTSAWQNPNNPIGNVDSIAEVNVPSPLSNGASKVVSNDLDNYMQIQGNSSLMFSLGQRALDFLRSFDDWVRRNNYSGSRAVQQIYSRFGIKTDDYRSNYAHVISTDKMPIQVGDVTSTADTSEGMLGEYSGKAIMNGGNSVYYKADDHGMIFVLGYFTVRPMMSFGFDRQVLRNQPLDYYNPEFDGIGADAISYAEVYENPIANTDDASLSNSVFGFTERYNSYRYGRDMITGEFRNYHPDNDMSVWHTGRNLNDVRRNNQMIAQSSTMNTLSQTESEYNRIFSVTSADVNHFYLTCHFDIKAIRPMLNLNQVVNLGVGDTNVPRNGNVIS